MGGKKGHGTDAKWRRNTSFAKGESVDVGDFGGKISGSKGFGGAKILEEEREKNFGHKNGLEELGVLEGLTIANTWKKYLAMHGKGACKLRCRRNGKLKATISMFVAISEMGMCVGGGGK